MYTAIARLHKKASSPQDVCADGLAVSYKKEGDHGQDHLQFTDENAEKILTPLGNNGFSSFMYELTCNTNEERKNYVSKRSKGLAETLRLHAA